MISGIVRDKVSMPALYAMLAEEAAELAHAACKAFRYTEGSNPTPLTSDNIHDMLIEDCNFEGTKRSAIEIYSTGSFKHKNITFRNVHFTKAQPYSLTGYENVNFENCTLD